MHYDHLYKGIYLHCTKHCIHFHPLTKPALPCKTKQKKHTSSFVFFPNIICAFCTGIVPHPTTWYIPFHFPTISYSQSVSYCNYSSIQSVRQAVHKSSGSKKMLSPSTFLDSIFLSVEAGKTRFEQIEILIELKDNQWNRKGQLFVVMLLCI